MKSLKVLCLAEKFHIVPTNWSLIYFHGFAIWSFYLDVKECLHGFLWGGGRWERIVGRELVRGGWKFISLLTSKKLAVTRSFQDPEIQELSPGRPCGWHSLTRGLWQLPPTVCGGGQLGPATEPGEKPRHSHRGSRYSNLRWQDHIPVISILYALRWTIFKLVSLTPGL